MRWNWERLREVIAMTKDQVFKEAMALDTDARADLAELLFSSVGEAEQCGISKAWTDEIDKRIDEIDRGEAETFRAEDVIEQLRAKHAK
jgi:putative addiction module component (TIGR02574 family)